MATKPKPSAGVVTLKPIADADRLDQVVNAVMELDQEDLDKYDAWQSLADLSSHTEFEGIEPHPDGIYETDANKFEAVATAYVTLNYGGKKDSTSMSDSYPARITGTFEANNKIKIDTINVDTSSFYE